MSRAADEIVEEWGEPTHRVAVPAERFERFRGVVPDLLLELWGEFGFAGFADGLWWLCDPVTWQPAVDAWIAGSRIEIGADDWIAVTRGAFGRLSLWGRRTGMSIEIVPHRGWVIQDDASDMMATPQDRDILLISSISSSGKDTFDVFDTEERGLFDRALASLGPVGPDAVYGFFPALSLGGSARLDRIEIVDGVTHLELLSDLTPRQNLGDVSDALRWQQVGAEETGLAGRTARLLTDQPTDDAGWPADLPAGTREVVIVDDEPNPTLTLRVRTPGARPVTAYVRFDQLAVVTDGTGGGGAR